jgi:hypothetical protein
VDFPSCPGLRISLLYYKLIHSFLKSCFCFWDLASTLSVFQDVISDKSCERNTLNLRKTIGERILPNFATNSYAAHRQHRSDNRSTMAPKWEDWQSPERMDSFANMYQTPLGLPRNVWQETAQITECPVPPTWRKMGEFTVFQVTMTTGDVHRLGMPRTSQITPIFKNSKGDYKRIQDGN